MGEWFEEWWNPADYTEPEIVKFNYMRLHRKVTDSYITVYHPNVTYRSADEVVETLYPGWDLIHISIDNPDWGA